MFRQGGGVGLLFCGHSPTYIFISMTTRNDQAVSNYNIFCDCFSSAIFERSRVTNPKPLRRRVAKGGKKVAKPLQSQEQGHWDTEQHGGREEEMAEFSEV